MRYAGSDADPRENRGPVEIGGLATLLHVRQFLFDPIAATTTIARRNGPFVRLHNPLPIGNAPAEIVLTARPSIYREILGRPNIWRTVDISMGGRRNHASTRLANGIVRMRGKQHAHYRRLIVPPLRQASVNDLGETMVQTADAAVSQWPVGEPLDLWALVRRLMQDFAISLLFGDDHANGDPIADLINQSITKSWTFWSLKANAFPFDIPGTPHAEMLRRAERLEALILAWAKSRRRKPDGNDLLSIVVNNPDENGRRPSDRLIAGHVPTLFGATFETCQNVMIWSLILLATHPDIAGALDDELRDNLKDGPPGVEELQALPLLDRIVRESMRILPPVPNQYRVALEDTTLGETPIRKGTRTVLSAFVLNREPGLYPEPDRFLPDRWKTIDPSPFEYAAFSGGPRACPGYYFGTSVVKVALATILSHYAIELVKGRRIDYRVSVTLSPFPTVLAILHPAASGRTASRIDGRINRLVRFPS